MGGYAFGPGGTGYAFPTVQRVESPRISAS
jgi:hypothetical protein